MGCNVIKIKRSQIMEGFVCHTREFGPYSTVNREL